MGSAYEYMFLLPDEHAELLKFKPQVPDGAAGMCSEILAPRHLLSNLVLILFIITRNQRSK
ncbi:hypothetical protein NC653_001217 [Populus alba x Populus x berolinensis]|uniref:Uncharacterized protein n=1 Tax=Populus alba x Populus x berolinensis TaxID=444605 RepID=A0AAD6WFQ1_9ROSI|nr:hypothetical protein NC653_001217 [Populus alba x Populus x berolinensis]